MVPLSPAVPRPSVVGAAETEPANVAELHLRAATWCEDNGQPEAAIAHAQAASDADLVARLVLQQANPVWASGRGATVMRWMEWFEANGLLERFPAIAVHGAQMHAFAGRPAATEQWATAAERTSRTGTLADGNTIEGTLAYFHALLCRDGVEVMRRDAEEAWDELAPESPYRTTMLLVDALSHLLGGDLDRADALLARGAAAAARVGNLPSFSVLLAERGIVAIERVDWTAATRSPRRQWRSSVTVSSTTIGRVPLCTPGQHELSLHRGDAAEGRQFVAIAARLRPLLTYALPIVSVQALLEMAHAYLAMADSSGARAVLRQVDDIFQQRPALGVLAQRASELRTMVDSVRTGAFGASALTAAELRLLPLLPTHLSFREIGERLYVSRHTVKTQAISIYRKLGVTSRSETITRMQELGLLEQV